MNFTFEASSNSTNNVILIMTSLDLCMYSINLLFGLPTHICVIWLIVTASRVASEFFYFNLSVCELGVCLNSLLNIISYSTMSAPLIIVTSFSLALLITGRPLFQCLICVERYLAVVHPVTFLKYKPLRYRVICCSVVWIITLGSCLICMFAIDQFYSSSYIYFSSLQFLLFLSIQLFCLVSVLRALVQSGPGERKRETNDDNQMKRRAFYLILITTVTMSFIYVPCIVSGFSFIFMELFIVDFFSFGFLCFVLAGFVEPFLYLHRAGKLSCLCSS